MIAFIDEVVQGSDFEDYDYKKDEEDEDDEDLSDEERERLRRIKLRKRVYRDYEDYLSGALSEGYYLAEDPVEKEINGFQVEIYEVVIERTARRMVTWVYDTDIAHIAIEFDFFEHQIKKERKGMERAFKSFKRIDRTIPLGLDDVGTFISIADLFEQTPEARERHRRADEDRTWGAHDLERPGRLGSGRDLRHPRALVRGRSLQQEARPTACTPFGASSTTRFPDIGPDEYVRFPLVRICKDREEVGKFRNIKGSSGSYALEFTTELVTYKDDGGVTGFESAMVNNRMLSMWLQDRNYRLFLGLPRWINSGLAGTMTSATVKGKKMKHGPSDWEREWIRRLVREERLLPARELMLMTDKEHENAEDAEDYGPFFQSIALTRFLAAGPGSKGKYKNILQDYMRHLDDVLSEIQAEKAAERERKRKEKEEREDEDEEDEEEEEDDGKPKNEEEEEEMHKKRKEELAKEEKRILQETFDRTFGDWDDKDWKSFENAYAKAIK